MLVAESPDKHAQRPQYFAELPLRTKVLLSQLPVAVSVGLVVLACLYLDAAEVVDAHGFLLGAAGIAALTVLAGSVPWQRLPEYAYWAIPLLDFVALAPVVEYARHQLDGMTMLAAFPVFWLGWSGVYPRLALVLSILGSAAVTWWPYVNAPEATEQELMRPLLVPLFMLSLAIATGVISRSVDKQTEELAVSLAGIRQRNRLLQTVLDTTDVGILVTDRHGNDMIMNPAQRRFHLVALPEGVDDGAEADLLQYRPDGTTPIPVDERPVGRAIRGESFQGCLIAVGPPPEQLTLSVSAQAMHDEDGTFDGTVVVFHDVTELMKAIQARDRFVADVSHEFRTPLTSIIGYLELARDADLDPELARYVRIIHRNAERLLVLVSSLLDAASTKELVLRRTDLVKLLRHSAESAAARARSAGVRLETDLPDSLPVVADRLRTSQIIDNLLSNAIKYTPGGGVVTLSARLDGDHAEFAVADTGIGMTPQELEHVFSSFYRTEEVRKAAIPGTGLGLSLAERFVREQHGTITVESEKGVGTVFTVRLPLVVSSTE